MRPVRTLLVDDNPSFRRSAARFLSTYDELEVVGTACSAEEAFLMIATSHPDLVLIDLVMPGLSGLEAAQLVKARPGGPRVIVISIHSDVRYRVATLEAGADGFLPKSELMRGLLPMIEQIFGNDADTKRETSAREVQTQER